MAYNRYNNTASYNYGSAAPQIYPEVRVPQQPSIPKPKKTKEERKAERVQDFKKKLNIVLSTVIVFIACTGFVWGCAVVSHKQYELKEAKAQVRELKSQVNTTKALIASATNLDTVKKRAINELHMIEPLAHQIIFLDIEKTSYTMVE